MIWKLLESNSECVNKEITVYKHMKYYTSISKDESGKAVAI